MKRAWDMKRWYPFKITYCGFALMCTFEEGVYPHGLLWMTWRLRTWWDYTMAVQRSPMVWLHICGRDYKWGGDDLYERFTRE